MTKLPKELEIHTKHSIYHYELVEVEDELVGGKSNG